jgi:hypothetical protein
LKRVLEARTAARGYERAAHTYLRVVDRLLPGRVVGFYLVGSAALGEYREGRSDLDFVAVLDRGLNSSELRSLRVVHAVAGARAVFAALTGGHSPLTGSCNGVFVASEEMDRPVTEIAPVASHTGAHFTVGAGFDVNPVIWKTLADRGVRFRGPALHTIGLNVEPAALRSWNLDNLHSYWRTLAEQIRSRPRAGMRLRSRWWTSWCVLGAPRLHHTLATGEVISKEAAGEYALAVFDSRWHPIIEEGLAYRQGKPMDPCLGGAGARLRRGAEFVLDVAASAA